MYVARERESELNNKITTVYLQTHTHKRVYTYNARALLNIFRINCIKAPCSFYFNKIRALLTRRQGNRGQSQKHNTTYIYI